MRAAVHRAVEERLAGPDTLAVMLEREASRGGLVPDVERVADLLLGPPYYRAIFTNNPADAGWARDLVSVLVG